LLALTAFATPGDRAVLEPQDSPDEPSGDRPACTGEEAYAKPDTDEVDGDGGGHDTTFSMAASVRFAIAAASSITKNDAIKFGIRFSMR
jgi:hypothetical protein